MSCITLVLDNFRERRDGARAAAANCAGHVAASRLSHTACMPACVAPMTSAMRIVADVQHLRRARRRPRRAAALKMRTSGLAAPAAIAVTWPSNKCASPQRLQIRVAVAEGEQSVARAAAAPATASHRRRIRRGCVRAKNTSNASSAWTRVVRLPRANSSLSARCRRKVRSWLCSGNCCGHGGAHRAQRFDAMPGHGLRMPLSQPMPAARLPRHG